MSSESFNLVSDLEFYCFLKTTLPPDHEIVAEPSKNYYSEWQFCYKVYRGDELIETYSGDFRSLERGSLVRAANELLTRLGTQSC